MYFYYLAVPNKNTEKQRSFFSILETCVFDGKGRLDFGGRGARWVYDGLFERVMNGV